MKKRVLAAILALVMLFGALPMSVFAVDEDVNTYADDIEAENEDVEGSNGSTTPTGKPAALSETHSFTIECQTDYCEHNYDECVLKITEDMYHRVSTEDTKYTIEFNPDAVNEALSSVCPNHELVAVDDYKDYKIDPMRIT